MNTNDFGRFLRGYYTGSKEDYKLWLFEMLNLPLFGINCFVYTISLDIHETHTLFRKLQVV